MSKQDPLNFLGSTYSPLDNEQETIGNIKIVIRVRWFVSPFVFLTLLYNTSESLNKYTRIMDVVDFILSELLNILQLDRALIYFVVDDTFLKLYMVMHKKQTKQQPELDVEIPLNEDAGLTAYAAVRKIAINITNPKESSLINKELAKKIGMNPCALAPLVVQNRVIGVIGIDRNEQNGAINDDEFQILKIFTNSAAIALNNFL